MEDFLITYQLKMEPDSFEERDRRIFLLQEEKLKMILIAYRVFRKKVPYERRNYKCGRNE